LGAVGGPWTGSILADDDVLSLSIGASKTVEPTGELDSILGTLVV